MPNVFGLAVFLVTVFPRGHEEEFTSAYLQDPFSMNVILDSVQALFANTFLIGAIQDTSAFGYSTLGLIISVILLPLFYFLFRRDRKLLLTLGVYLLVTFTFYCAIYTGGVRQWGMVFIFFICLLEIRKIGDYKTDWIAWAVVVVFGGFNLIHGVKATYRDIDQPFTNAEMTANYIKENIPEPVPIIAINKFEATPVIGYADRKFL